MRLSLYQKVTGKLWYYSKDVIKKTKHTHTHTIYNKPNKKQKSSNPSGAKKEEEGLKKASLNRWQRD